MLRLPTTATNVVRRTMVRKQPLPLMARRSNATAAAPASSAASVPEPLSKPTLHNIEKRWEVMPLQEQAELWMALRDRMKGSWHDLTLHEKKAAYWIAFGPHGPRALDPPGENMRVFALAAAFVGLSGLIFVAIRYFANPPPETMTKEWQEAANEKLKEQRADPLTGISSEGYKGRGMVQSPPKGQ